jgi:hypothetical protein
MLLSEITFRILQQIQGNTVSDDSNISTDLIVNQIISVRKRLSAMYLQSLPNVELKKADKHDICGPIEDCILRSVNPIPKFVDTSFNDLVTYLGTNEGDRFERTTLSASRYITYSKYTGSKPKFYFVGDYLYIVNPTTKLLKYITITGVFEDPRAANSFQTCGNFIDCFDDLNFEFPLSATLVDNLIQLVVQEIRGTKILPTDKINNTKDDSQ